MVLSVMVTIAVIFVIKIVGNVVVIVVIKIVDFHHLFFFKLQT